MDHSGSQLMDYSGMLINHSGSILVDHSGYLPDSGVPSLLLFRLNRTDEYIACSVE